MDWNSFLYAFMIAIVTGGLSILGVVLTLRQNNKQLMLQMKEKIEDKQQAIIDNRPELEIISHKEYFNESGYFEDEDTQIDALFIYQKLPIEKYNKKENFARVEYVFRNIGKSVIESVDLLACNNMVNLVNISSKKISLCENSLFDFKKHIIYSVKKIHTGDTIKVRIWYHKDHIIESSGISYLLQLILKSFDKRYWYQNFGAPDCILEESELLKDKRKYYKEILMQGCGKEL